jgi:thioredoxin reductase (NADPH)
MATRGAAVPDLDLVIVGGGPAGIAAALWAWDLKLRFAALDAGREPGGQLHRVYNQVADYPGVEAADGAGIARAFAEHLARHRVELRAGVAAERLDAESGAVEAGGVRLVARFVLLATGVRRRALGVPGEAELAGRGVCPSATRHAGEFAGRRVLVAGGGDAALEEALILAEVCDRVTLAHRGASFRARPDFRARVAAHPRIEVLFGAELRAIVGDGRVEGVRLNRAAADETLAVEGVFVCVGVEPNSEIARGQLGLDPAGYVVTDVRGRTSADRVYAAGDVRAGSSWTIAGAVGDGASAVKDVSRRLSSAGAANAGPGAGSPTGAENRGA